MTSDDLLDELARREGKAPTDHDVFSDVNASQSDHNGAPKSVLDYLGGNIESSLLSNLRGVMGMAENTGDKIYSLVDKLKGTKTPFIPHMMDEGGLLSGLGKREEELAVDHPVRSRLFRGAGELETAGLAGPGVAGAGFESAVPLVAQDIVQNVGAEAINNPDANAMTLGRAAAFGGGSRAFLHNFGGLVNPKDLDTYNAAQRLNIQDLPLGESINNKGLVGVQRHALSYLAGSNYGEKYASVAEQLNNKAAGHLENLLGGSSPNDITDTLVNHLLQMKKLGKEQANKNFGTRAQTAAQVKAGDFVFRQGYLNKLNGMLQEKEFGTSISPGFKKIEPFHQFLRDESTGPTHVNLDESQSLEKSLNAKYRQAKEQGNFDDANAYNMLKHLHRKDETNSLQNLQAKGELTKEGVKSLQEASEATNKQYVDSVVPFKTKEMQRFLSSPFENRDSLIEAFVKPGQYEKPTLLKQLTSKLSPKDKELLAHAFLSKGMIKEEGLPTMDLNKLKRNYDSLGPKMKKELFGSEGGSRELNDIFKVKDSMPKELEKFHDFWEHNKNILSVLGPLAIHPSLSTALAVGGGLTGGLLSRVLNRPGAISHLAKHGSKYANALSGVSSPVAGALSNL